MLLAYNDIGDFLKYYLVGIKGSGMSALACMLHDLGHTVMGSDYESDYDFNDGLKKRKIKVFNFNETNIEANNHLNKANEEKCIYIISSAYDANFIETKKIIELNKEYYYYHEFISMLPGIHIAVSGTHGKTTTTKMIVDMLDEEEVSCIIGSGYGKGVKDYKYLIYEACEYKEHFLAYNPDYLIITNIDYDHPDYYDSLESVNKAFEKLKTKSKFVITKDLVNYQIIEKNELGFKIQIENEIYNLPFYGEHMIDNFICVYQLLKIFGYDSMKINEKIKNISLPTRRMQEYKVGEAVVIFDYAHHPTEISSVHQAIKHKYPDAFVTVFFEPHTYSRTIAYLDEFVKVLSMFDKVYIKDVFSSRREKKNQELQAGIDEAFNSFLKYDKNILKKIDLNNQNIYVFLGAGTIYQDALTEIMKMD